MPYYLLLLPSGMAPRSSRRWEWLRRRAGERVRDADASGCAAGSTAFAA